METGDEKQPHKLIATLQERRERHRSRHFIYRAVLTAAGFTVLGAGIAMLVLPGPALAVIPIGLAILALEFTWAERLLEQAIHRAEQAKNTATDLTPRQRLFFMMNSTLVVAAIAAWAIVGDIPIVPVL